MLKNNFLWEFVLLSKFQNPIEKFDKEFWEKVGKLASLKRQRSGSVKGVNKLLVRKSQTGASTGPKGEKSLILKSV